MSNYREQLITLVQDVINSYDTYLEEPEHWQQPADLQKFLAQRGFTIEGRLNTDELEAVRSLRHEVRSLWTADNSQDIVMPINVLLGQTNLWTQLHIDSEKQWVLEYHLDSADVVKQLTVQCGLGLVFVLQDYGLERMGTCAAEPCRDVYVDTSRNRSRRFCSDRCANRYSIASYRERQRSHDDEA